MSDSGGGGGGRKDVLFILLLIGALVVFWISTGGPDRANVSSLFLSGPQAGVSGGTSFITLPTVAVPNIGLNTNAYFEEDSAAVRLELERLQQSPVSSYRGKVTLGDISDADNTTPDTESIVIQANNSLAERIVVTGWRVESAISGKSAYIGKGVETYTPGQPSDNEPVVLNPGDTAILTTGRSPIGTSFRVNLCTGYLSQFQTFTPELPTECPYPERELTFAHTELTKDNDCMDYLESIGQCKITPNPPLTLSANCRAFITNVPTYQGCLERHRTDTNFKRYEWRVFLKQPEELWRTKREVITLIDAEGRLVDTKTY